MSIGGLFWVFYMLVQLDAAVGLWTVVRILKIARHLHKMEDRIGLMIFCLPLIGVMVFSLSGLTARACEVRPQWPSPWSCWPLISWAGRITMSICNLSFCYYLLGEGRKKENGNGQVQGSL